MLVAGCLGNRQRDGEGEGEGGFCQTCPGALKGKCQAVKSGADSGRNAEGQGFGFLLPRGEGDGRGGHRISLGGVEADLEGGVFPEGIFQDDGKGGVPAGATGDLVWDFHILGGGGGSQGLARMALF